MWFDMSGSEPRWILGDADKLCIPQNLAHICSLAFSPVKAILEGAPCDDQGIRVVAVRQQVEERSSTTAAQVQARKDTEEPKFSAVTLLMGNASESDSSESIGLDDKPLLSEYSKDPLKEMRREWFENSSDTDSANFEYIRDGQAIDRNDIPLHEQETIRTGLYHGWQIAAEEYDTGHDGWTLTNLMVNVEITVLAGLREHHVVAIRAYTSDSFRLFNGPM